MTLALVIGGAAVLPALLVFDDAMRAGQPASAPGSDEDVVSSLRASGAADLNLGDRGETRDCGTRVRPRLRERGRIRYEEGRLLWVA